jgi:outer membrane immunogenic protein
MIQTLTKSAILAVGLTLLNAPSYAGDATQLHSDAENSKAPVALTETGLKTKTKEYPEFWTGFYGGINLGGKFASADLRSNQLGFINPDGKCNVNSSIDSFFPGVQFGYLHQFESNVVLGVEGDFTYNTQNRTNITCPCPTFSPIKDRFRAENLLQGSLRGRLGYAVKGNLLPFVSVGVSFADMGIKYSNEVGNSYNKTATQAGWLAGAGLEWGFSDDLSVRAEYYYSAYNKLNIAIPSVYGLTDLNGGAHLNLNDNTVRVALNYWF